MAVQDIIVDSGTLNATVSGSVAVSTLPSIPAGANAIGSVSVTNFPATQAVSGTTQIGDGITPSTKATVAQFHNSDNQSIGTGNGLYTGGVAQILNAGGLLDRQRGTTFDNVPALGIATGTQQLASPYTVNISQAITLNASAQAVTVTSMTGTNNGAAWSVKVGSALRVDSGANQEDVVVTAVTSTTFTAVFTKNHVINTTAIGFAYNQARDATVPDGSNGAGFGVSATTIFNGALNSGAGGWEYERSAAGELDGANGRGTNVAAEYEYNGGGPGTSGKVFDRARNLQGKGSNLSVAITTPSVSATSIVFTAAPTGLQAGSPIFLFGGTTEVVYAAAVSPVSGTTVTLDPATPVLNASHTTASYDVYAAMGPGLNGFTPVGLGIEEEALYNPADGNYYIERSATADAMPGANIVAESGVVWNGTTFDRMREATADALAVTGIAAEAAMIWNGTTFDRLREATADGLAATGVASENVATYNGTTFDRLRGNVDTAALVTLTAAATGGNSTDQTNYNGRGLKLVVNATAVTGTTPVLTVTVQGKDAASGAYYNILTSANITATGATVLTVYPGAATTANVSLPDVLPRTWRVLYTVTGTTPAFTATIGASVIV